MENLKKCPFCGGEAEIESEYCWNPSFYNPDGRSGETLYYAKCKKCIATTKLFVNKEGAIQAWNRRINKS